MLSPLPRLESGHESLIAWNPSLGRGSASALPSFMFPRGLGCSLSFFFFFLFFLNDRYYRSITFLKRRKRKPSRDEGRTRILYDRFPVSMSKIASNFTCSFFSRFYGCKNRLYVAVEYLMLLWWQQRLLIDLQSFHCQGGCSTSVWQMKIDFKNFYVWLKAHFNAIYRFRPWLKGWKNNWRDSLSIWHTIIFFPYSMPSCSFYMAYHHEFKRILRYRRCMNIVTNDLFNSP